MSTLDTQFHLREMKINKVLSSPISPPHVKAVQTWHMNLDSHYSVLRMYSWNKSSFCKHPKVNIPWSPQKGLPWVTSHSNRLNFYHFWQSRQLFRLLLPILTFLSSPLSFLLIKSIGKYQRHKRYPNGWSNFHLFTTKMITRLSSSSRTLMWFNLMISRSQIMGEINIRSFVFDNRDMFCKG